MPEIDIRSAYTADAAQLLEIYRPFVESTVISFELSVPIVSEFEQRITTVTQGWAWLVAEVHGKVAGYAYGSAHRPRQAYQYSVEVSAYVSPDYQRRGIAAHLYTELFVRLAALGYVNAYAGIALPNDASIGFHRHQGFASIGVFPRVGFKFDRWHDVAWMHRPLDN
ncbi:MAG: N-acetyltransferase family protein, partial [Pseudomonadota bacterium]